jgi:DNA-binding NarL/FixJ family response regulator
VGLTRRGAAAHIARPRRAKEPNVTDIAPIRLLVLDRLPLVHAGVRQLLAPFPDIEPAGAAYDLSEAIRLGAELAPTLALVEIDDLGPEWPGAIQRLAGALQAPVAVFTARADDEAVRQALRAGAQGFLLKSAHALPLAQALREIAAGARVLAPELARAGLAPAEPQYDSLTQREREVLALLARGLSNREIGLRLHVSNATVKFHCGQIFSKLGVRSRAQAVAAAFTHNLVPWVAA